MTFDRAAPVAPPIRWLTAGRDSTPAREPQAMALGPVIADVAGLALTDVERERLLHPLVGGVILFARNYEPTASRSVPDDGDPCAARPRGCSICVDHEGGRVQRFRDGFSASPRCANLGRRGTRDVLAAVPRGDRGRLPDRLANCARSAST